MNHKKRLQRNERRRLASSKAFEKKAKNRISAKASRAAKILAKASSAQPAPSPVEAPRYHKVLVSDPELVEGVFTGNSINDFSHKLDAAVGNGKGIFFLSRGFERGRVRGF